MVKLLEEKFPEKYFFVFLLFFIVAFWFRVYLVSILSFVFFNGTYEEVLFLRDGHWKLEMSVEVITSKVPSLHRPAKGRL